MRTIIIFSFVLFIVVTAKAQDDPKNMAPPAGKSLVYFVRSSKLGALVTFFTTCDDKMAGKTKGNRFFYTITDPGEHKMITTGGEKDATLDLTTEADKVYYVELVPKMGLIMARVRMEQITEEEGKKKLNKCKLLTTGE